VDGVWDPKTRKRLPLCLQDSKNLTLAGDALYNTCSLQLRQTITNALTDKQRTGPFMLSTVIFKIQRPSKAKTEQLKAKAKELSVRNIPGKSVEAYNILMTPISKDIAMSIMNGSEVPNLPP
jgi:hypothetical protein